MVNVINTLINPYKMVLRTPNYLRLVLSSCNLQMFSLDFLPQRVQSVQQTTDGIMFYGL